MADMNNEIFSVFDRFYFFTCFSRFNAYVSKKRGSRYLKNASFDLADFFTQDSCHHSAQNEPWNKGYFNFSLKYWKNKFLKKNSFGYRKKKIHNFFFPNFLAYSMAHFKQKGMMNLVSKNQPNRSNRSWDILSPVL